ncbi:ribonuclease H-like domain-containing protein [Tanacetum coccineum]
MTRSFTKELFTLLENPKRVFRSKRRLFETRDLVESNSPEFDLFSDIEERSEEEGIEEMTETIEQYMSKTIRIIELRNNTFSGSEHEDANEHIEKVLEIVDLFHIPNITQDQILLRAFPVSLTRAASRWLRNEPTGSILTWEVLKLKFLSKYCPPARTAKKMDKINNFQQILDSKGAIPTKTAANAKVAIQEMAEYSQKWHNETSRTRSTETSDGLVAIQAQLNSLGREIKKVNEKVYVAQVGCELCKGPHYTKDCPLKKRGKPLKKLTIDSLVHPTNLEGNIEQQGQDSTNETTKTLQTLIEDKLWRNR